MKTILKPMIFLLLLTAATIVYGQGATGEVAKGNLERVEAIIDQGDLDKAEIELTKLLKSEPNELEYLAKYGSVLIQKEDSTGIIHLEKVIHLNPDHLFARKEAGRFYMMQGVRHNSRIERTSADNKKVAEFKEARDVALSKMTKHYEKVVEIEPKDQLTLQALMNVYGLLQDEKNYERIVQLMEALKNHP